jgi:chitinase
MRLLSFLSASLLAVSAFAQKPVSSAAATPIITAYVFPQENVLTPGSVDAQSLTRINYAFANIEKGRIVEGFPHDAENYAFLNRLKAQNPSLTVLVSVGGWLWSNQFSDMCLTAETRRVFIDSVMDFLSRYKLDGLDIDWEYPGMEGATKAFRPEDKENFTALLKELRVRFEAETRRTHKHLYLTIAAGSGSDFIAHTEMDKISHSLDDVNLMCYDYYEPSEEGNLSGHHSPLYPNPADPRKVSDDRSIQEFLDAGVPASKLVLGVPFYGHAWGKVAATNHGLFQTGKAVHGPYNSYGNIQANFLSKPGSKAVRYWDDAAQVPYVYDPESQIFISYEDPQSIALKSRYVLDHHLAGIMFWDYESDPTGALLKAINDTFHAPSAKGPTHP